MEIPQAVLNNAPTLIYSKGEKYYPCDLFFSGKEVINNKEEYDKKYCKTESKVKLEDTCCYYHVTNGKTFTVLQYWYYYANNYYTGDDHEHDFECVKVFVDKNGIPKYVNCNIHYFNKIIAIKNGEIPEILVDVGSHAMLPDMKGLKLPLHTWIWHGEKDAKQKTLPKKDMEELRQEVMKVPYQVMDEDFKIIGNDYQMFGKLSAPTMPWARIEYYLPEKSLKSAPKQQVQISTAKVKQTYVTKPKAFKLGGKSLEYTKTKPEVNQTVKRQKTIKIVEQTPSLEFFLGSKPYAYVLSKTGINSIQDLSKTKAETIQLQMKTATKQEGLNIEIPSIEEISRWKENIH